MFSLLSEIGQDGNWGNLWVVILMHTLNLNADAVKYILNLIRKSCLDEQTSYSSIVKATNLVKVIEEQSGITE